jgi:DNA-binding XRE family transcriptional regulator
MTRKLGARAKKAAKPNSVKRIRTQLGMSQNDLAKLAEISVASIRSAESLSRDLSGSLKARIVTGFNKAAVRQGKDAIRFRDLFPNDIEPTEPWPDPPPPKKG